MDSANHVGNRGPPPWRGAFVPVIIMILAMPALFSGECEASINPIPEMTITLDPLSQEAVVSEGASGTVQFTGSLRIDKLVVERGVTSLTCSVDTGWVARCSPSAMVITDTVAHSFSVSVIVPQATPSNVIGTLRVEGCLNGGGFVCIGSAQAIITVKPYYRVRLETAVPFQDIPPGFGAFFSFKVYNEGNAIDSFEIGFVNMRELVDKHWTIGMGGMQVAKINPGEYKTCRFTAQSPRNWTIFTRETVMIDVKASSLNAKEEQNVVSDCCTFIVHMEGGYSGPIDLDIGQDLTSMEAPPFDFIPQFSAVMILWGYVAAMLPGFIGRRAEKNRRRRMLRKKKGDLW
jgi:hypothetical protein